MIANTAMLTTSATTIVVEFCGLSVALTVVPGSMAGVLNNFSSL